MKTFYQQGFQICLFILMFLLSSIYELLINCEKKRTIPELGENVEKLLYSVFSVTCE